MLRDGMPVDVSGWNGLTALQQATATTDVIKHLVHKGADVNRQTQLNKNTPLHYAAQDNNTVVTQLLLKYGADMNLKNINNKTSLDYARKGSEIESLLLHL